MTDFIADLNADLVRICAEIWNVPVRAVGELHVRSSIHLTGDSLSVRFDKDYVDPNVLGTDNAVVRRKNVWVPAVNGHDLPWQLSPKIAARIALRESNRKQDHS